MNKKTKIIIGIIILLIIIGGSFYGGMLYGRSQKSTAGSSAASFAALRGSRTGSAAGNFISGTIIAEDSSSITLQMPANVGGSKIIFYSGATQISKTTAGTANDLTNGTTVSVTGTTNSDGSITANSIQIRPTK